VILCIFEFATHFRSVARGRCWPFREAQQAHLSVSFGENRPLTLWYQQKWSPRSLRSIFWTLKIKCCADQI